MNISLFFSFQAYVAEGMALYGLGKYEESLAALAEGLSACPNDYQLLKCIIDVALKRSVKQITFLFYSIELQHML